MNCKNCDYALKDQQNYCEACGAKVVKERITFKKLINDVIVNAFGLDNRFFYTIIELIKKPNVVFKSYLSGTRKKYINPFTFFAVCAGIGLIFYNSFSDEYFAIISINQYQEEKLDFPTDTGDDAVTNSTPSDAEEINKLNARLQHDLSRYYEIALKYSNFFLFLQLPFYSLLAYWVYKKPYNFGEHIIINAYLLGVTFLTALVFFLICLATETSKYFYFNLLLMVVFYTYAYTKLYQLSFWKATLKLLRFLLLFSITYIIISIIFFAIYIYIVIG